MTTYDLASSAFRLALHGFYVFRLQPGKKGPLHGTHGHLDATREVDVVRLWWRRRPRCNIGVETGPRSQIWILDVDPKHNGLETLARLEAEHGPLLPTVEVSTPSGGRHCWFRWPDGTVIRNSAGKIGEGIDVRGEGGHVPAPPSRLSEGRGYTWAKGPAGILPAPDWLVRLAAPAKRKAARKSTMPLRRDLDRYVAAAVNDELAQLEQAREGRRNDQLNRSAFAIAGLVKAGHLPHDWAIAKLEATAVEIGLSLPEARSTIASAFQAAQPRVL